MGSDGDGQWSEDSDVPEDELKDLVTELTAVTSRMAAQAQYFKDSKVVLLRCRVCAVGCV